MDDGQNIASFRRQIRVIDKNDNAPKFVRNVYKFDVDETEPVGKTLFTEIAISDQDEGKYNCFHDFVKDNFVAWRVVYEEHKTSSITTYIYSGYFNSINST